MTGIQPNNVVYPDRDYTSAVLHKAPSFSVVAHSSRGLVSTESLMPHADWQLTSEDVRLLTTTRSSISKR